MAFLAQDDKLQDSQGSADLGQGSAPSSDPAPLVNDGGGIAGSQVSTAGVGKGGKGNFTNIQAYLEANKGNNTTGDALNRDLGSEFDTEKSKIQSDSEAKKSEGASKVSSLDNLRQTVGKYATGEDYSQSAEDQVKQGLAGQYTAPKVAYTLGQNTAERGQQLQSDQGFDALLNQTYDKAAGGQISAGQKALQRQLDSRNDALAGQRQDLAARYKALQSLADETSKSTNDALSGYENQYKTGLSDVRSQLGNAKTDMENQLKAYTGKPQGYDILRSRYEAISKLLGQDPSATTNPNPVNGGDYVPNDADANVDGQVSESERFANLGWQNGMEIDKRTGLPWIDPGGKSKV